MTSFELATEFDIPLLAPSPFLCLIDVVTGFMFGRKV